MMDGIGQIGAGTSDNRLAGTDLQHNRQTRTADELHVPVRIVTQPRESGGPMKQEIDGHEHHSGDHGGVGDGHGLSHHGHHHGAHPMRHHLDEEKQRHEAAMEHHHHHLERHHGRHYDSQHGHDHYSY